jgi:hypothetical protein
MAHAFAQPPYPAARSTNNLLQRFAVDLWQITRRPAALQQAQQAAVGHKRHTDAQRVTAPGEQALAFKV